MPRRRKPQAGVERGLLAATIARHPREFVGIVMAGAATLAILVNALFLQHGPHPAPIFATLPLVVSEPQAVKEDRRGVAPAVVMLKAKPTTATAPGHQDPIAELLAPSPPKPRVLAIQHALADFGYGQIKPTGVYDNETRAAIEKFEREHNLPVDGQITDRFERELAGMTGRSLE